MEFKAKISPCNVLILDFLSPAGIIKNEARSFHLSNICCSDYIHPSFKLLSFLSPPPHCAGLPLWSDTGDGTQLLE
jgi:fumarate reductase subunit D